MKVEEIMSKDFVLIKEDEYVTKVRKLMREQERRALPVVNEKGHLLGIITESDVLRVTSTKSNVTVEGFIREVPPIYPSSELSDLARAFVETGEVELPVIKSEEDPEVVGIVSVRDLFNAIEERDVNKKVSEIMTEDVIFCSPEDPISKVWNNIIEFGYTGFPVVKDGKVIGIVTRRDLLKYGSVRIGREDERGSRLSNSPKVERAMTSPVQTISPDSPVREALELMRKLDIGRLPVVDRERRLLGIVDRYDIIKSYFEV
ncbi:MAG: CBS domain-containing protein [Archaeoglobi archaeon]|nr:CBS domain-containing protein [Candidatus Mnemosynella sp.]